MKAMIVLAFLLAQPALAAKKSLPARYIDLLPYVQEAPDQGETNTCWFQASTGAMELLLNKKHNIKAPKKGGRFDLSESFMIYAKDFYDPENPPQHFIEEVVQRFNSGEAVLEKDWPFISKDEDGNDTQRAWWKHEKFDELPRIKVPKIKTELLFAKGRKYATHVLEAEDLLAIKKALVTRKSPVIVNYNDDGYWHVILIVGFDDNRAGECYELEKEECNKKGSFYVRDSDGKRFTRRAYNWFLIKGNAAAAVELK